MSKQSNKVKNPANKRKPAKKTNNIDLKRRRLGLIMLLLAIPVAIGLVVISLPKSNNWSKVEEGPQFTKQGELTFVSASGEPLRKIDIEVKQNDVDRQQGMMWRKSMKDTQGMLFIMDRAEQQSFWMLNTYVPLDIIYVDENYRILNIAKNTKPQSLDPVFSKGAALYVVEVIAGFCDQYGIKAGDSIQFELEKN
ncbi:MAG TPA: DUF192 domain-containing protein [Saprospiraceae bacterium]|nr:DUF192 domain-containing protein [Saprospiraceae bacterium]HMQ85769.1 DUF192 domain-containing protein [Saprospiraceae bacterium]